MLEKEHLSEILTTSDFLIESIVNSKVNAIKVVNSQKLRLYYFIGAVLSAKTKKAKWGDNVLKQISDILQNKLPGIKGFSAQNLKKMRHFFETYPIDNFKDLEIGSMELNQFADSIISIGSTAVNQFANSTISIGSPAVNQIGKHFWNIGFSLHYLIVSQTEAIEERAFYILKASENNWTKKILENHLKNKLFFKSDLKASNFETNITNYQIVKEQFRDEYLLDFVTIEEAEDERKVESKIVANIRDFLLNLGTGFSFLGNQYRLQVDDEEYFIDLLFYNRQIKSLVAIELKKGKFTPKDAGQLNFYLNVLDKNVKLEDENPSIGIVLCREKKDTTVEFALQNINSPMGVALYKSIEEIPEQYKKILPKANDLIEIMKFENNDD